MTPPDGLEQLPPEVELRLVSGVGRERRAMAQRTLRRPAVGLLIAVAVFALMGAWEPTADGALVPPAVDELQRDLPLGMDELDLTQLLVLPFIVIAAVGVVHGALQHRTAAKASLRIHRTGRLIQADGGREEHVDLDHLLHVDVAPNRALTDVNERRPVGSLLVLRLRDATGSEVDVNPGMWAQEGRIVDIIRRYAWDGHATITREAAERYDLPVRGRSGDHHDHADEDLGPALEGLPARTEAQREAPLRERGIEVQRAPEVEPDGLDQ
jgi:hypothetical protein